MKWKRNRGWVSLLTTLRLLAVWSGTYRGYQIVGCTPCSAGGVHLVEMLNILEHFDVEGMGFGTVEGQPTTPLFPLCSTLLLLFLAENRKGFG